MSSCWSSESSPVLERVAVGALPWVSGLCCSPARGAICRSAHQVVAELRRAQQGFWGPPLCARVWSRLCASGSLRARRCRALPRGNETLSSRRLVYKHFSLQVSLLMLSKGRACTSRCSLVHTAWAWPHWVNGRAGLGCPCCHFQLLPGFSQLAASTLGIWALGQGGSTA